MRRVLLVLPLLFFASSALAQQPSPMGEGTSSISGRVIAADTRKPIAGALVQIVIFNNLSGRFRQVTTDAQGKYEFTKLPAGEYRISAQGTRYIAMQYGQQQGGPSGMLNPARSILLTESQAFTTADFALDGYCAIEGKVVDEFGDPVPNVAIQVSQVQYGGGRRRLMPANIGADAGGLRPTDDLGRFRIGGLLPGDYYVEALSGAFADPNAAGGFAVTFFPGTSKASAAQAVSVSAGHDATGLSFALEPAPGALVSGTVVDGMGHPLDSGDLMLAPSEGTGAALFMIVRGTIGAGGRFTFRNVPPGTYMIQAYGPPPPGNFSLAAAAFGYQTFTVAARDLDNLTVSVPTPRVLRGHITFDGDLTLMPKTTDVLIAPRPVNFESAPIGGGPPPNTIREDWTFEVGAMSGLRALAINVRPAAWILKRATLNGQDVTDAALDLRERDVDGLEIVLTTRASTLTGTVADAAGKALANYTVIVFADDETKWNIWSRYVMFTRTGATGTFGAKGLPAGNYLAVAVASAINGEWQDPEYLKKLRASADVGRFTMTEEGTATVTVVVRK